MSDFDKNGKDGKDGKELLPYVDVDELNSVIEAILDDKKISSVHSENLKKFENYDAIDSFFSGLSININDLNSTILLGIPNYLKNRKKKIAFTLIFQAILFRLFDDTQNFEMDYQTVTLLCEQYTNGIYFTQQDKLKLYHVVISFLNLPNFRQKIKNTPGLIDYVDQKIYAVNYSLTNAFIPNNLMMPVAQMIVEKNYQVDDGKTRITVQSGDRIYDLEGNEVTVLTSASDLNREEEEDE